MKLFFVAAFIFTIIMFTGCSDDSQSPVSTDDRLTKGTGSLQKNNISEFTAISFPIEITNPGIQKFPDGRMTIRDMRNKILFFASFPGGGTDLLSGEGELELNGNVDPNAGVTRWWGKLTLTPTASEALGGQWEFTWQGDGTLSESGWTIPLKELGHGNGGALTGLQCFVDYVITAPPDFSYFTGAIKGYVKSH